MCLCSRFSGGDGDGDGSDQDKETRRGQDPGACRRPVAAALSQIASAALRRIPFFHCAFSAIAPLVTKGANGGDLRDKISLEEGMRVCHCNGSERCICSVTTCIRVELAIALLLLSAADSKSGYVTGDLHQGK